MFDLHKDHLMAMLVEERRAAAEAQQHLRRGQQRQPALVDRLLARLGAALVWAGSALQRRVPPVPGQTLSIQ